MNQGELIDLRHPARVLTAQSTVGDLPLRTAVRVPPECPVQEAVAVMERAGVSSLLVDGDGIVTERDLARALGHGASASAEVGTCATWHPMTVPASTTILDAAALMLNEHVRHLVVDTGHDRAVVSLRDVAALLLQVARPDVWFEPLRVAVAAHTEIWLG